MAKTQNKELAVIDFTQFSVAQLPELKGKKEEINSVIEANPIVEIVDNATHESAKKSRTAVKTLRTSLEKEKKEVNDRIKKNVLEAVSNEYDLLIADVKISESDRQLKVDAWETKKEEEKQEKARLEQERIDGIKTKISDYVASWKEAFRFMVFGSIKEVSDNFHEANNTFDKVALQEFDVLFDREVSTLTELLESKISTLKEQEQIRVDNLLLEEKNAELKVIQQWQSTWNLNIETLLFSDIADVKSVLVKSKLANLKHYVSGYEEIYTSTEKRLNSQIEFVSKAEEQRIAQEKLDQEKKEFEEKQAEVKFQGRVKQLTDLGIHEDVIDLGLGNGSWANLKHSAINEPDETWNDTLAWVKAQIAKRDEVAPELSDKPILIDDAFKIEEIEVVADEVVNSLEPLKDEHIFEYKQPSVEETMQMVSEMLGSETPTELQGIFTNSDEIQEVEFEETWDSILRQFHESESVQDDHSVDFVLWLEKHYNVPSKKQ